MVVDLARGDAFRDVPQEGGDQYVWLSSKSLNSSLRVAADNNIPHPLHLFTLLVSYNFKHNALCGVRELTENHIPKNVCYYVFICITITSVLLTPFLLTNFNIWGVKLIRLRLFFAYGLLLNTDFYFQGQGQAYSSLSSLILSIVLLNCILKQLIIVNNNKLLSFV